MSKYGFNYYKENKYVPKHITVDLGAQTTAKTGGAISSRQVIDVVDEKGEKIRGFFTENEIVDAKQLFISRAGQLKAPDKTLGALPRAIFEKCAADPGGMQSFIYAIYKVCRIDFSAKSTPQTDAAYRKRLPDIKKVLTDSYGIPPETLASFGRDNNADEYVKGVLSAAFSGYTLEGTHTEHQRQQKGTNINRRNNAMSDYAQIIGMPELVAKSTSMTVINGDNIMHGSFMVNAKGVSYKQLGSTNPNGVKELSLTPGALKQISNMQILDYLCANIDRHAENMFYQIDDSDPFKVKITGIQGIDNDASFGKIDRTVNSQGKVFDRMSLLKDIKVMDRETADKIKKLNFNELEEKLRLAGLSAEELSAAYQRLEMLQERLNMSGKIEIIENDAGWEKLYANKRRLDNLSTNSQNVALMGKNTTQNKRFEYMDNIYGLFKKIARQYERVHKPSQAGFNGEVPTAAAVNILDNYGLDDHAAGLEHIRDEYRELIKGREADADILPALEKLASVTELMKELAAKDRLGDNERNLLSESLKELSDAAEKYERAHAAADLKNPECHAVRNIKAYAAFAREAIRNDAPEAEMNLASKGADDIRRARGIAPTHITYEALSSRVGNIAGRSTVFYRNMISAFENAGKLPPAASDAEKKSIYDELMRTAAGYLAHKIPSGSTEGLNDREKARVRFAQDVAEYAAAQKQLLREKAEAEQLRKQERDDYSVVSALHAKCARLVENYENADSTDAVFAAAEDILDSKDDFKKGLEQLIAVSRKYPAGHDMQAACSAMLTSGIGEYMKVFLECDNSLRVNKGTDVYEALGLDASTAEKVKGIVENGRKVLDGYEKQRAAAKIKTEAPEAVNEKNAQPVQPSVGEIHND